VFPPRPVPVRPVPSPWVNKSPRPAPWFAIVGPVFELVPPPPPVPSMDCAGTAPAVRAGAPGPAWFMFTTCFLCTSSSASASGPKTVSYSRYCRTIVRRVQLFLFSVAYLDEFVESGGEHGAQDRPDPINPMIMILPRGRRVSETTRPKNGKSPHLRPLSPFAPCPSSTTDTSAPRSSQLTNV
jgi:hypothetical protein